MKTSLSIIALVATLVLPNLSYAGNSNSGNSCSLTGSYTMNFKVNGILAYGVMTANDDGTVTTNHSFNLTQSQVSGPGEHGLYGTIQVGVWKKTGSRTFKLVNTCVDLIRDASSLPGSLANPATPIVREKGEVTVTFDKSCNNATFSGQISLYNIPSNSDDLSLSGTPGVVTLDDGNLFRIVP
ncbi:MAG: hypothetical protein JSR17_06470 [Proteobacteria bacterium]|nr:hypothetical protein [Pseudomonadota bacterium]